MTRKIAQPALINAFPLYYENISGGNELCEIMIVVVMW